jgi:hypothetical protein
MARLILFLLLFAVAVLAVASVMVFLQAAGRAPVPRDEDRMPANFRMVAYLLLLALMVGVTTGWLGAV